MFIFKFFKKKTTPKPVNKYTIKIEHINYLIEEVKTKDIIKLLEHHDTNVYSYKKTFHENSLQLLDFSTIISLKNRYLSIQAVETYSKLTVSVFELFKYKGSILDPVGTFESFIEALEHYTNTYDSILDKQEDEHNKVIGIIVIDHYIEMLTIFNHILPK